MHTDNKKPTGGSNLPAGNTDGRIVPGLALRIKLALLVLALIFGGLR